MKSAHWLCVIFCALVPVACSTTTVLTPSSTAPVTSPLTSRDLGLQEIQIRKLRDRIWLIQDSFPEPAYSLVVDLPPNHLLRIDTAWTPEAEHEVLRWIKKQFGKRKISAINTHFHLDRTGGNAALVLNQIPIHGSTLSASLMRSHGEQLKTKVANQITNEYIRKRLFTFVLTAPTRLFDLKDGLKLDLGGHGVEVVFPGPGHSPDNVVVWVPELKLLFAGGLAIPHLAPGQLATADLAAWKFSLERLKSYPAEVVIPAEPGTEESGFGPDLLTHSLEAVTRALAPPPVPGEIQKGSP